VAVWKDSDAVVLLGTVDYFIRHHDFKGRIPTTVEMVFFFREKKHGLQIRTMETLETQQLSKWYYNVILLYFRVF